MSLYSSLYIGQKDIHLYFILSFCNVLILYIYIFNTFIFFWKGGCLSIFLPHQYRLHFLHQFHTWVNSCYPTYMYSLTLTLAVHYSEIKFIATFKIYLQGFLTQKNFYTITEYLWLPISLYYLVLINMYLLNFVFCIQNIV